MLFHTFNNKNLFLFQINKNVLCWSILWFWHQKFFFSQFAGCHFIIKSIFVEKKTLNNVIWNIPFYRCSLLTLYSVFQPFSSRRTSGFWNVWSFGGTLWKVLVIYFSGNPVYSRIGETFWFRGTRVKNHCCNQLLIFASQPFWACGTLTWVKAQKFKGQKYK